MLVVTFRAGEALERPSGRLGARTDMLALDPELVAALAARLARRNRWRVAWSDGEVAVTVGASGGERDETLRGALRYAPGA